MVNKTYQNVSVVLIAKNQLNYLKKSIPAICNQEYKGKVEIIVVDSGSTDGTLDYLRLNKIKIILYKLNKFNYAQAFNLGASNAQGNFLVRLSGDCIPVGKSWLQCLIDEFSDTKIGAVYGKYIVHNRYDYDFPSSWPASRFPKYKERYHITNNFLMGLIEHGDKRKNLFNLAGGCYVIRKDIWKLRKLNINMSSGEDGEYAWFLHLLGFDIVYTPNSRVLHEHKKMIGHEKLKNNIQKKIKEIFVMEILKYWLLRLVFIDKYKQIKAIAGILSY
jgi:glycosyltransferase involved in cell wall biosynthesis